MSGTLDPSPGTYRYRARRGAPWQAVRITHGPGWNVYLNGALLPDAGVEDWIKHEWLLWNWPLHPIDEREYDALLKAAEQARPGDPLATPDQPVNLRAAPSLYRGKST